MRTVARGSIRVKDRHSVPVHSSGSVAYWPVASLRGLFRGNRQPPADMRYPEEFVQAQGAQVAAR